MILSRDDFIHNLPDEVFNKLMDDINLPNLSGFSQGDKVVIHKKDDFLDRYGLVPFEEVYTIDDVFGVPTSEDPKHASIFLVETPYILSSDHIRHATDEDIQIIAEIQERKRKLGL